MLVENFSFDVENPKYRQFKRGNDILEYTLEGNEITVDWVAGTNVSSMIVAVLAAHGNRVNKISGYVTDKLGSASDTALLRFSRRMAGQLGTGWRASIQRIEGRRYLVFAEGVQR